MKLPQELAKQSTDKFLDVFKNLYEHSPWFVEQSIERVLTDEKYNNLETFHEFIEEATGSIVETDWTLSDFKVTLGTDSAHISYYNNGIFKTSDGESIHSFWMESVFLVVEEGELKVQFLQSDIVEREIKE